MMALVGRLEQYIVTDNDFNERVYEDFEVAMRAAINLTTQEKMTTITMADGRRFTILETTKATVRRS